MHGSRRISQIFTNCTSINSLKRLMQAMILTTTKRRLFLKRDWKHCWDYEIRETPLNELQKWLALGIRRRSVDTMTVPFVQSHIRNTFDKMTCQRSRLDVIGQDGLLVRRESGQTASKHHTICFSCL